MLSDCPAASRHVQERGRPPNSVSRSISKTKDVIVMAGVENETGLKSPWKFRQPWFYRWWWGRRVADVGMDDLDLVKPLPAPSARDIVCVSRVYNEILRLPAFLRHYRAMGVDRFAFVDHASDDGSGGYLGAQPDVELYRTEASFTASGGGIAWVNAVIRRQGAGRWILAADIDELLVYDGCAAHDLHDLGALLDNLGLRTLCAILVDMYGEAPIGEIRYAAGQDLIDACPYFDGTGYDIDRATVDPKRPSKTRRHPEIYGGPRRRLFHASGDGTPHWLWKTPFAKWDRRTLYAGHHVIYPYRLNFSAATGGLLHFKLLADFHDRAAVAVARGEYDRNAAEYRAYLDRLENEPRLTAMYDGSRRYDGPASLIEAGLMDALPWQ